MGHYNERTSTFFTRLTYALVGRHLTIGRSPAPQTSLIFELPDELILSILSHITPEPRFADHYARLRLQYDMAADNHHRHRVRFLISLSMTCKAMRFRLLPWIWERIECAGGLDRGWGSERRSPMDLNVVMKTLRADISLATSVRFMTVSGLLSRSTLPELFKCLESLPNLHTLEMGEVGYYPPFKLRSLLERVNLPQVKALILPAYAYPLLDNCRNVEDVVYVVQHGVAPSDEFCEPLASNQNSQVKRLAVPLSQWSNPSRYIASLPKLTELTLLYPRPPDTPVMKEGVPPDVVEATRSTMSEVVDACKALPDFGVLQIVHFLPRLPPPGRVSVSSRGYVFHSIAQQRQKSKREVNGLKGWAMDCLRTSTTDGREGKGRKGTVIRVIELSPYLPLDKYAYHLDVLEVEEYKV